jgi:lipoate-protein ligase A
LLDLTLATAAENVALDEALLDAAEANRDATHVLRLWESPDVMVVVGRGSRTADEVDLEACARRGVPVLRRTSGGAAIVAGPGCLMYALVLSQSRGTLPAIDAVHSRVLSTMASAVGRLVPDVAHQGTSDLAVGRYKFSGNSMRCKRTHVLYHGTLLYDFQLTLISDLLKTPPRQPEYRQARSHADFVRNLQMKVDALRGALVEAWQAYEPCGDWPHARVAQLVREKYGQREWNERC